MRLSDYVSSVHHLRRLIDSTFPTVFSYASLGATAEDDLRVQVAQHLSQPANVTDAMEENSHMVSFILFKPSYFIPHEHASK